MEQYASKRLKWIELVFDNQGADPDPRVGTARFELRGGSEHDTNDVAVTTANVSWGGRLGTAQSLPSEPRYCFKRTELISINHFFL